MGFNYLIEAVADHFSGPRAPGFTFAGMFWRDTSKSPAILRVRNDANTAWIDFRDIIGLGKRNSPTFVGVNATGNVTATGDVTARNVTATSDVTANNVEVNNHIEMHASENHTAYIDYRSNGRSGDYDWRTFVEQGNAKRIFFRSAANKNVWFDQDGGIGSDKYGPDLGFTGNLSESGYQKLPSGLIIQWGKTNTGYASYTTNLTATFPIVFPHSCFQVVTGNTGKNYSSDANLNFNKTGLWMTLNNYGEGPTNGHITYIAIGY